MSAFNSKNLLGAFVACMILAAALVGVLFALSYYQIFDFFVFESLWGEWLYFTVTFFVIHLVSEFIKSRHKKSPSN